MKKLTIFITALILIIGIYGAIKMTGNTVAENTKVKLETTYGDIIIELNSEKAPITVENFQKYVEDGFYDGTVFHRVIDGFMIQGGGYTSDSVEKETRSAIKLESNNGLLNKRGTIAMARTNAPDSATSQFFINVADNNFLNYGYRDEGYAVFGKVTEGMDVVDKIAKVQTDSQYKPLNEVKIVKAEII